VTSRFTWRLYREVARVTAATYHHAEHTTAVSMLERLLHHATVVVHRGRVVPHERVQVLRPRRWSPSSPLIQSLRWGLLMATSGDFNLAIDT
jgi:hypothetical protein